MIGQNFSADDEEAIKVSIEITKNKLATKMSCYVGSDKYRQIISSTLNSCQTPIAVTPKRGGVQVIQWENIMEGPTNPWSRGVFPQNRSRLIVDKICEYRMFGSLLNAMDAVSPEAIRMCRPSILKLSELHLNLDAFRETMSQPNSEPVATREAFNKKRGKKIRGRRQLPEPIPDVTPEPVLLFPPCLDPSPKDPQQTPLAEVIRMYKVQTFGGWIADHNSPEYKAIVPHMDKLGLWASLMDLLGMLTPSTDAYRTFLSKKYEASGGRFSPTTDLFEHLCAHQIFSEFSIDKVFETLIAIKNPELTAIVNEIQNERKKRRQNVEKQNAEGYMVQTQLRDFISRICDSTRVDHLLVNLSSNGAKNVQNLKKWKDEYFEKCGFNFQEIIDIREALDAL